jgi:putative acetyltransferase
MKSTDLHVAIRDYHEIDLEAVAEVWLRSWQSTGVDVPVTLDELRSRLPDGLARDWTIYVATTDEGVAGFLALCADRLEQLFVAPEWQNRGIGKLLLDFVKNRKPEGFGLHAAAESRAIRFYEREGLMRGETGTHPRHGFAIVSYYWLP